MRRIHLIEGNQKHAQAIKQQLEKQGFSVELSSSISTAQKMVQEKAADLLVIDLNISNEQILDFYYWLMHTPKITMIPRLFLANDMKSDTVRKLAIEEKEEVLGKPLDTGQFLSTIQGLLKFREQQPLVNDEDYLASIIGRKLGSVTIEKEIARGGMGAVFLGCQKSLNRNVAVKLLLPSMVGDPYAAHRFHREARATAKLKSPHIVQIFDFGEIDDKVFFLTMEYLTGQTLEHYLKHFGKFPLTKALFIISQIAKGLKVAHEAGLVHRDIKPSNLIISADDHVSITDFGLVRSQQQVEQTQTGMIVGTPQYLPPEQATGKSLDARSDIYALGIVFYQLLVGSPPFLGHNTIEVMMKHIQTPLPDPRTIIPDIPEQIITLLNRMTAKLPENRYSSCGDLLKDLKSIKKSYSQIIKDLPQQELPTVRTFTPTFAITPPFDEFLADLEGMFPSLFSNDKLLGTMTMTSSGTFLNQQGKFPEGWLNIVYILQESVKQINEAVQLGNWRFNIIKSAREVVTLFPMKKNLGALLMAPGEYKSHTSSSLLKKGPFQLQENGSIDPIKQIASVSGVRSVLLFNQQGDLQKHKLEDPEKVEDYRARLSSVARIFQSISLEIISMDLWLETGRFLFWNFEHSILFLVTTPDISHSFLSILIASNMESLNALAKGETPKRKKKKKNTQDSGEIVPNSLIDQLQTALTRFIGPIARLVLQKEAHKIGYSLKELPFHMVESLFKSILPKIDPEKQEEFTHTLEDIIFAFRSKKQ